MHRIYNAGEAVDKYCLETSEGNSGWDVCDDCITTLDSDTAPATYGLHPYQGDPAGTKLDLDNSEMWFDDHYLYSSDYRCELCDTPLWDEEKILLLKEVEDEDV